MVEKEYAKAIFELAKEENKIDVFDKCFDAVVETSNNEEFMEIILTPSLSRDEKKEVIKKVYKSLDKTFIDFLFVLLDHNRFELIEKIYDEYKKNVLFDKDTIRVKVYSAKELTDKELKDISKSLAIRFNNKKLAINNIVNPELIGGVRVVCNHEAIDLSLKASLDKLKESL